MPDVDFKIIPPHMQHFIDKTSDIVIEINGSLYVSNKTIAYHCDIDYLPSIMRYVRGEDKQITWFVNYYKLYIETWKKHIDIPKFIVNYICNGDSLYLNCSVPFENIEHMLELFKGIRFNMIRTYGEFDAEILQFISDILHTHVYYMKRMNWILFEPEDEF